MRDLTIVIPVRNMAGKLKPIEESISAALRSGFSVVVVHDKADEPTEVELRTILANQEPKSMDLLTGVYNSPGGARNAGIQRVKTEWVAFWDSDDRPVVENLIKLYELVKQNNADLGIGDYADTCFAHRSRSRLHRNESPDLGSIALSPGIWRMVFRTSLVAASPFQSFLLAEDQTLLSDIEITSRKTVFLREIVYNYLSGNPASLTGQRRKTSDLTASINHIYLNTKNQRSLTQQEFDWIMIAKQTLTLFRYGSFYDRLFAIRRFAQFLFVAPRKAQQTIFGHVFYKVRVNG